MGAVKKKYIIHKKSIKIHDLLEWESDLWRGVNIADIKDFHPKSSSHQPLTQAKIIHDNVKVCILFKVYDQFIKSTYTKYNSKVHEDSCVEWFLKPPKAAGYYNFEMNAGGTLHVNYIIDPERGADGKRKNIKSIPEKHAKMIKVRSSLPAVVDPEINRKTTWYLAVVIPYEFFKLYTPVSEINGSIWQGNLYKCADKTSHPHWGYWNPIKALNFHLPECFGEFEFVDH